MFLSKRRNGFWYLYYDDQNEHRQKVSTKCRHKSDALKFLQCFKSEQRDKKTSLQRLSLREFADNFRAYSRTAYTPKTQGCFDTAFRELERVVGNLPLLKIGVKEIEHFLSFKKGEASDWTARCNYIALASAFQKAVHWNCLARNPFREVQQPRTREVQPPYFNKEEFRELMLALDDAELKDVVICAVSTGLRLGELLSLRWEDVDLPRRILQVRNSETFTTKNKRNRVVPLNSAMLPLFSQRKEGPACNLVFNVNGQPHDPKELSKRFKRYVLKAGLNPKLHFHSLRHTFASWLVQDGVSLYEVQKLLGHSSSSVTQIYSHLQPEQMHATVNRIDLQLN